MKIAINLIPFSTVQGIEIFSKNIILSLLKLKENEEFFILGSENMPEMLNFSEAQLIKSELKSKCSKALYQQTLIYPLLKKYKIDLLFSPSPAAPFFYKNKVVVIHDCAYDRFKEFENALSKIYFRAMFYGAKYFSKKIITVSNFSKKEFWIKNDKNQWILTEESNAFNLIPSRNFYGLGCFVLKKLK